MNNDIYKDIAEQLLPVLPRDWEDVKLYSQITNSSYEFFFYTKINGKYIQCFNLEKEFGITKNAIRNVFKSLYSIVKSDYDDKKWFAMTYSLKNNGKFNIEYEYTDYSDKTIEYKELWKTKYLK